MEESLHWSMAKGLGNLNQHDDTWDLPAYFLLRKNKWNSLQTHSGYWKEKEEELTAIRSAGESSSSSSASPPPYVGVRKTLEFYLNDGTNGGKGTKTDWIIHEYYDLHKDDAGASLFLQDDVVLRKVFKKCKNKTDQESSLYRQVKSCMKAYKELKQGNSFTRQMFFRGPMFGGPCYASAAEDIDGDDIILHTEGEEFIQLELAKKRSSQRFFQKLFSRSTEETIKSLRNKDLGDDCHQDGKSDNVWKHFTKIRSANDPDEVYAACHRCDKLLKAHPRKHGISHLKRHIHTCSSCTNPSTDEDREMLHRLRTVIDNPYEQQKMDEKLNCQEDLTRRDPWDLNLTHPTVYVTRSFNRKTQGGQWKEINKEFTAIRRMDQQGSWKDIDKEITVIQMDHQLQMPVPRYIGLRRTLQFHHQDGRKMDWIMLEYQQLDDMESPALLLKGCMVIRKVFWYDKDAVGSTISELDRLLIADDDDEEYFNGDGVNTDITTPSDCMDSPCSVFRLAEGVSSDTTTPSCDSMDTPVDRKRKRTGAASGHKSEVWMHFTKIYNTDYGVVYVVCHTCDRGYGSGRSTNGTSHLWRHNKSCTNKHRRKGNANDATAEWEAEIWPVFLLLKNYGEHQLSGAMC